MTQRGKIIKCRLFCYSSNPARTKDLRDNTERNIRLPSFQWKEEDSDSFFFPQFLIQVENLLSWILGTASASVSIFFSASKCYCTAPGSNEAVISGHFSNDFYLCRNHFHDVKFLEDVWHCRALLIPNEYRLFKITVSRCFTMSGFVRQQLDLPDLKFIYWLSRTLSENFIKQYLHLDIVRN